MGERGSRRWWRIWRPGWRTKGRNPAILTRGYERQSSHDIVIVPRGSTTPVERTGDEAQMLCGVRRRTWDRRGAL